MRMPVAATLARMGPSVKMASTGMSVDPVQKDLQVHSAKEVGWLKKIKMNYVEGY